MSNDQDYCGGCGKRIVACGCFLASPVQGAASAPACTNAAQMGEHACANRSQCWEPCGELGKSAEHCKVAAASATDQGAAGDFAARLAEIAWQAVCDGGGRPDKIAGRLRAALAERAQAAQPSAPVIICTFCAACRPFTATPAPEQEAAPDSGTFSYSLNPLEHMPVMGLRSAYYVKHPDGSHSLADPQPTLLKPEYRHPVEQEAAQVVAKADDQSHVMRPFGAPAGQHDASLTVEEILRMVCDHTGKRINLCLAELGEHIDLARAVEEEVACRFRAQGGITNNESSGKGCATATNTNQPEGAGESE